MVPARLRAPFEARPLAREGLAAAAASGAFLLWTWTLWDVASHAAAAVDVRPLTDSTLAALAVSGLAGNAVVVAGMVAFAAAYARGRDLTVPLSLPDRADLPVVAAAAAGPPAAVAAVYGLARLTGTSVSALSGTFVASDTGVVTPAVVTALGLLVGLPAYVLFAHVVVQRTLRRAGRPHVALAATTFFVGLTDPTGLASPGLPLRTAAVTVMLLGAVALPAYAAHAYDRAWLTRLCSVPLAMLAGGLLLDWAAGLDGPAAAGFALAKVGLVALGAYAVERTDSLVAPAVAYAAFVLSVEAVVVFLEAGVPP